MGRMECYSEEIGVAVWEGAHVYFGHVPHEGKQHKPAAHNNKETFSSELTWEK